MPPALLRFRVSESISADEFLRIGHGCANLIRQHVDDMASAHRVLDFGCGCGRTIRWFLGDGGSTELHGVDVDREAVEWCRTNLPKGHFLTSEPQPPLPYPSGHFDLVYCFSVFTHLNESMQDRWLAELSRIIKPGGLILLTVHGEAAAPVLDAQGRETLRLHGFLHLRSQKLRGLMPDWYHTTWHSREYIVKRLSPWFKDIRYSVVPGGLQDAVVAKRTDS